ncbi:hypothetical protein ACLI1A_12085 [Flavobacterium sp. RHBU_3]|uniref:hypothetical protein n=1 Tax=Flavobacterium sp. RHBU_3 TaxID=3391184 RepID=UPI0039856B00
MDKLQMRNEAVRLLRSETPDAVKELLSIYIEFLLMVINKNHHDKIEVTGGNYAPIILQMITTKLAHLNETIDGVDFNGVLKNKIIDLTVVATISRSIFEMIGAFNLVFITPKNYDEQKIMFNLWALSGLNYRQRFNNVARTQDSKNKVIDELNQIEILTKEITETELFKQLSEKNQSKILSKIKAKDYKIIFETNNVAFLDWKDLIPVIGMKEDLMEHLYTYFSLYAHPSFVSVFQYGDMYKDDKSWIELTIFNLKNVFFLVSSFIADYIKIFPNVLYTFENLSLQKQIAIDWQNTFARGEAKSINNCIRKLD